ncbi:MAG: hypothetical protein KDB07_12385, partial [Planctomycetes bacterium]|nr:hypothetical protein [Planctomycetota bacterium]
MAPKTNPTHASIEKRATHWSVYAIDRSAGAIIRVGGLLVILAVIAIIVFIASEAFPLFKSADSGKNPTPDSAKGFELPNASKPLVTLADSNRRMVLTLANNGEFLMTATHSGKVVDTFRPPVFEGRQIVSASVSQRPRRAVKIQRWGWLPLGSPSFKRNVDRGIWTLDKMVPNADERTLNADGSVTHYLTNIYNGDGEHDGEYVDMWGEVFPAVEEGVPAYVISVLLDDGSTYVLQTSFYSSFHSFDPRYVPSRLSEMNHPTVDEFSDKGFSPDTLVVDEHRIRGESAESLGNGSERRDESNRPIRYRLLQDLESGVSPTLDAAQKAEKEGYAFAHKLGWYPGTKAIAEKRPGFGVERGRALLTFRTTSVDISVDYKVEAPADIKPEQVFSDFLPNDFRTDKEQRKFTPKFTVGNAWLGKDNRVFVQQSPLAASTFDFVSVSNSLEESER